MNILVVAQQSRRLEDDDGIMGKTEIAGQTGDETGGKRTAIRIIRGDRANAGPSAAQFGMKRILLRVIPP